jgi:hypothetical protein
VELMGFLQSLFGVEQKKAKEDYAQENYDYEEFEKETEIELEKLREKNKKGQIK